MLIAGLLPTSLWAESSATFRHIIDTQQQLKTPAQALAALAHLPEPIIAPDEDTLVVSLKMNSAPVWFEARVPKNKARIVIEGGWLMDFELYLVDGERVVASHVGGSKHPASERPLKDPRFVYPVEPGVQTLSLLVHHTAVETQVNYPIRFFTVDEYAHDAMLLHLRHGGYYGLLLLVLIFTVAMFLTNRRHLYFYFSLHVVGLLLCLSTFDGFLGAYVLPSSSTLLVWLPSLGTALALSSVLMFALHFLGADRLVPRQATSIRVLAGLLVVHGLVSAAWPNYASTLIEIYATFVVGLILLGLATWLTIKKSPNASLLLLSLLPTVAASSILGLSNYDAYSTFMVSDALFLGASAEVLILAVAVSFSVAKASRRQAKAIDHANALGQQIQQLQSITDEATQLRNVQRSVQEAQRVRSISQLASGIAHDFNNIFTSVMGFSELLGSAAVEKNASLRNRYIEQINTAGQRGANLVQQLLIYSRAAKPNVQRVDLNETVANAIEFVRRGLPLGTTLTLSTSQKPLATAVDEEQFKQVLINLVVNSSEAMQNQGSIEVNLEQVRIHPTKCSACLNQFSGERIVLSVSDRGPGIDEPVQDLFTPFHTSKSIGAGSGLGLSVVDGIVHEHGGHLLMANRTQGGTRVDVCLPLDTSLDRGNQAQARILFVHTGHTNTQNTLAKLQRYYQVTTATRASQALELFLDNRKRYGLIAIEITAPHETWLEIAIDMRSANPEVPILLLTTDSTTTSTLADHSALSKSELTNLLDVSSEHDSLLSTVESLLHPHPEQAHNIQSLRIALRRLQNHKQ
ncbi:MAG: ATP-binding protein [Pseudomonadales bacterium]